MRKSLTVFTVALAFGLWIPPPQALARHRLARVEVKTQEQFERLASLDLDIASSLRGSHVDVVVESSDMDRIALLGFKYDVIIEDVEAGLSSIMVEGLSDYHSYSEAVAELLAAAAGHSDIARAESIGRTYEDRPIWAIKISDNPLYDDPFKPDVLFVGLHHARELMTVEVVLYLMNYLLDNYGVDPHVTHLVNDREIWIVPVLNPDGHVYMEGQYPAPIWRKNRKPTGMGCIGIDLNRNYGFMWGYDDQGSSPSLCSETYRGPGPFSELETRAVRDLIMDEANNFTMAVSYHSYGRLILFPWGYTNDLTPDHDTFQAMADSMAAYNRYTAGPGYSTIYSTNGDMDDWMYGDMVVTGGLDPETPPTEKDRIFAFTFEVGNAFIYDPPGDRMLEFSLENLRPNLFAIEYADDPYRVWPPEAPEMEEPVPIAGGGWEIRWKSATVGPTNAAVAFELEEAVGSAMAVDDLESAQSQWEGNGFELSQVRSHSGSYSTRAGQRSNASSILEPIYPLSPSAGDSLSFRAWYSLPPDHQLLIEVSEDGGVRYVPLPGLLVPPGLEPLQIWGTLTGDSQGWAGVHLPLDSYAGRRILLRLRCVTSGTPPTGGVYIDDIGPILTCRERRVLETPLSSARYRHDPVPEAMTFRARAIDADGQLSPWSSPATIPAFQGALRRLAVAPNPISSNARVSFLAYDGGSGPETIPVRLEVFDAAGRMVRTIFVGQVRGDRAHEETWDGLSDGGSVLPSGVYFVVLSVSGDNVAEKVMLVGGR